MAASMRALSRLFYRRLRPHQLARCAGVRLLLTDEYKCVNAWRQQLQTPLLQNIDMESFAMRIQEKLDKHGTASAVDMDIVACKLEDCDRDQLDAILNLFYRFRHSKDAVSANESMSHAVIRSLLSLGETDRLLGVLRDKIHYGIFLDHFTANLLLDHFITQRQFAAAAEVAVDLMWQEDLGHPLCRALSWRACHLRLAELLSTAAPDDGQPGDEAEAPTATAADDEEEVTYYRVDFIPNPWYDDHFDIATERQRIGKTLTMIAAGGDDVLTRGSLLVGWALYEKLDNVVALMSQWADDDSMASPVVSASMLDLALSVLESIETGTPPPEKEVGLRTLEDLYPVVTAEQKAETLEKFAVLAEKLKSAGKVDTSDELSNVDGQLSQLCERIAAEVSSTDIETQTELYGRWTDDRQSEVDRQVEQHQVEAKKKDLVQRILDLRSREEKLRYFEQESTVELRISERPPDPQIEEAVSEEEFVAAPGERRAEKRKR